MDERGKSSLAQEYATKLTLMGVFLVGIAVFVIWRQSIGQDLDAYQLNVYDLVLLGFATLRLGRMIAYDLITEPLRSPFTKTVLDQTGAGDTVVTRGRGIQRSLGQMISCPICAGTWVSGVLVLGLYAWTGPTRIFITILGVIGFAELLNALIEGASWSGQEARARAGAILKQGRETASAWQEKTPEEDISRRSQ